MARAAQPITLAAEEHVSARDWFLVGLFTFAGAVLRFTTIEGRGLWLDEAITIVQTSQSLPALMDSILGGVHPPLFHILMHYWIVAFGVNELAVRTFACLWGVAAIPAAFWAGMVVYDKLTGFVAAGIVAYSPYLIWYSQEARMYSMMFFFGLLSVGFLVLAIRGNRRSHWVWYFITTLMGMFTHYFFAFVVLGEVIYFLAIAVAAKHVTNVRAGGSRVSWRSPLRIFQEIPEFGPWLIVMVGLAVPYALWVSKSVFLPAGMGANALVSSATGSGLGYGQEPPSLAFRINDIGMVFTEMLGGFHQGPFMYAAIAMWPIIISVALVFTDFLRPLGRRSMLPPIAAATLLIMALLGFWQGQVLASRYFIGAAAPAALVAAAIITGFPPHVRTRVIAIGFVLSIALWADQSFDPKNLMRYDTREAIAAVVKGYQPGDVVIYEPFYTEPLFKYYLPSSVPSYPFPLWSNATDIRRGKNALDQDLDRVTGTAPQVWVIMGFENLKEVGDDARNTKLWFEDAGYTIAAHEQLNQVEYYRYIAPKSRLRRLRVAK